LGRGRRGLKKKKSGKNKKSKRNGQPKETSVTSVGGQKLTGVHAIGVKYLDPSGDGDIGLPDLGEPGGRGRLELKPKQKTNSGERMTNRLSERFRPRQFLGIGAGCFPPDIKEGNVGEEGEKKSHNKEIPGSQQ